MEKTTSIIMRTKESTAKEVIMKKDLKKATIRRKVVPTKDTSMKMVNIGVVNTAMNLITHMVINLERKVESMAEVNMVRFEIASFPTLKHLKMLYPLDY